MNPTGFEAVRTAVAEHDLTLVRAHPRADRLHLDLTDAEGNRVIGQWLVNPAEAEAVAAATGRIAPRHVRLLGHHLLIQGGGADRRLPALAPLVAEGAQLVVHRPERRAVVRTVPAPGAAVYTKVVRPRRAADLARRMGRAAAVPGLLVPQVDAVDEQAGTIRMTTLPGRTLHDLLAEGHVGAGERIGATVRTLHSTHDVDGVPDHDLAAEVGTTQGLIDLAREHGALEEDVVAALEADVARAASVVEGVGAGGPSLLHRDLHDKQLLVEGDTVGMLDVDTLGVGDPALDLGNLLAHLDLRVQQGWTTPATAGDVEEDVLQGYRPDARTLAAAEGYRALTHARLRALYAFRPGDLANA